MRASRCLVQRRRDAARFHLHRRYRARGGRLPRLPARGRWLGQGRRKHRPHAIYNIGNSRTEDLMRVVELLEQATAKRRWSIPSRCRSATSRRPSRTSARSSAIWASSRPPPSIKAFRASFNGIASITAFEPSADPFRLRFPVIAAPMFIVSNPKLVIAQCTVGDRRRLPGAECAARLRSLTSG